MKLKKKSISFFYDETFVQALKVLAIYWNYRAETKEELIKEIIIDLWSWLADVRNISLEEIYFINSSKWEIIEL